MKGTSESHDALPVRTRWARRPQRRVPAVAGANSNGQQVSFTLGAPGCGSGLGR